MHMRLKEPRVAVKVKRTGDRRTCQYKVIPGSICLIDAGTQMISLDEISKTAKICDPDDKEIKPTGTFFITSETIDPYHLVIDWFL